jgi:nitroreductase
MFLIELLVEVFGELLLQLLFEGLAEIGLHVFRKRSGGEVERSAWLRALGYVLLGLLAGGLSLWVHPQSFIHASAGRLGNLLLAPVAMGLSMAIVGAWRQKRGQQTLGIDHFAYGYLFALSMSLVRFFGVS